MLNSGARRTAIPATASIAALAGGLLALAYPPFPLGFLAYGAIALLLYTVRTATVKSAAAHGFIFGFVFHVATIYWTGWVSVPGMLTMCVVLALYIAIVTGCWAFIRDRLGAKALWLFPVLWVAHEYLRGLGDLAFPWTNLSLTQVRYLPLIQFADLTGDLGVSLWVALINILVLQLFLSWRTAGLPRRIASVGILAALFVLPYAYGSVRMSQLSVMDTLRVAVLQGDIDSYRKWDSAYVDQSFANYEAQTRDAAAHGARLIVWPETAAPVYLRADAHYHHELKELSRDVGVPLLVGTLEYQNVTGGGYLSYNAAVVLDSGRYRPDFHAKLHLVPLGEWIPFSDKIKILDRLEVGGAHFTAGTHCVLFDHPSGPYAAAICYEAVFPEIPRRFAAMGARFFVSITNDGWYGFSSGPIQHALICVFRAIETRRPIARSANTGVSTLIDRAGRLHAPTAQYVPDVLLGDLDLGPRDEETFFVRHGLYIGWLCLLSTVVFFAFALMKMWRASAKHTDRSLP